MLQAILGLASGVGIGLVAAIAYLRLQDNRKRESAQAAHANIISEAETKGREIVLQARDEAIKIRDEAEKESNRRRRELDQQLEQFTDRREKLDRRFEQTENRARNLEQREQLVNERERQLQDLEVERQRAIERAAGMSREEARNELLERVARTHPGQVLELELEREDGRWIYEVKLLQPGGRIVALEVDARSAELLKQRSRDRHPPEPGGR